MKDTAKPKRPTPDDLARRMEADRKRQELEAEARRHAAIVREIDGRVDAYLKATNKATSKFGNVRATLETVPGRVSWKDEFLRIKPVDAPMPSPEPKTKLVITEA